MGGEEHMRQGMNIFIVLHVNGLHTGRRRTFDVFQGVVQEDDLLRWKRNAVQDFYIDSSFGFAGAHVR